MAVSLSMIFKIDGRFVVPQTRMNLQMPKTYIPRDLAENWRKRFHAIKPNWLLIHQQQQPEISEFISEMSKTSSQIL